MSSRDALYRLIDELPESELHTARRFLEYLRASGDAPPPTDSPPLVPLTIERESAPRRSAAAEPGGGHARRPGAAGESAELRLGPAEPPSEAAGQPDGLGPPAPEAASTPAPGRSRKGAFWGWTLLALLVAGSVGTIAAIMLAPGESNPELWQVPEADQGIDLENALLPGFYPLRELSTGRHIADNGRLVYVDEEGRRVPPARVGR